MRSECQIQEHFSHEFPAVSASRWGPWVSNLRRQGERLSVEFEIGPASLDEVIVIGIRGAQAAALNEQRTNDNISNVISADQLGIFPDRNIAEAMRRIPGVSVEREEKAGDGRYVSIRGLDSALNNFKLNGMNVAQQEEDNRRVALDIIQVEALHAALQTTLAIDFTKWLHGSWARHPT